MIYDLYTDNGGSGSPVLVAQKNLMGRTHYVDPSTLRFHFSRVINAQAFANGLLFGIVTSDGLDMHNSRRGFRWVVFDIAGNVVVRPELEDAVKSSAVARKRLRNAVAALDAAAVTRAALKQARERFDRSVAEIEAKLPAAAPDTRFDPTCVLCETGDEPGHEH